MNLDMEGKVVFVSGSSRGIGLGIAKTLLEEGCNVIINGRDEEKLNQAKLDLKNQYKDNILAISGDVNEIETINKVKKRHLSGYHSCRFCRLSYRYRIVSRAC